MKAIELHQLRILFDAWNREYEGTLGARITGDRILATLHAALENEEQHAETLRKREIEEAAEAYAEEKHMARLRGE